MKDSQDLIDRLKEQLCAALTASPESYDLDAVVVLTAH